MDIVSDILLFATYLESATANKTVPMQNDSSVLNITGRTCTFVEEYDDSYKFSCDERNPMFAALTLLFIYSPSLNVLATLYGPRTAGILGAVWGLVIVIPGWIALLYVRTSKEMSDGVNVMVLFLEGLGMVMFLLGFLMVFGTLRNSPQDQDGNEKSLEEWLTSSLSFCFLPHTVLHF